jgi:cation diffusion facilitator CzcD-associated flavoprotein CzcO
MLAAQLQNMGMKALIVDKHPRVGDSWRVRYKNVYLNTPTFTDHYPFLKYPDTYPKWLSRDQVADFMEHYQGMLGLEVLVNTEVTNVERADDQKKYNVTLRSSDGTSRTLTTSHVVLATGVYAAKPIKPQFEGEKLFKGTIYHSSEHKSAEDVPNLSDKNVVVIGPGTSGHDIAQDFAQCGAKQVTMIQRHPIFSLSADSWENLQLGLWKIPGISTEEADLVGNSIPLAVARSMSIRLTKAMAAWDKDMLDGLKKAGMLLRTGEDGFGLADHQLIKGGHYYIDQGASQMIIDGRIKIRQCEEGVKSLSSTGLVLADGEELEADIVVLATGFEQNIATVRQLLGDAVADKMPIFGDLDKEQERNGVSLSPYGSSSHNSESV